MENTEIENIIKRFDQFTQKPVNFLEIQTEAKDDYKNLVKSLYDFTKIEENFKSKSKFSALPKLIIEDFDEEQIWQQIELQNNGVWDQLINDVAACISVKEDLKFPVHLEQNKGSESEQKINKKPERQKKIKEKTKETNSKVENNVQVTQSKCKKRDKPVLNTKKTVVDDDFFKLDEMEQFLLSEERKLDQQEPKDSDEESIDYFEGDDYYGDDNEKDPKYDDFFENHDNDDDLGLDDEDLHDEEDEYEDNELEEQEETLVEPKKQVRFAGISETSSEDSEDSEHENPILDSQPLEKQSEFEQRQARLKLHIDRLENKSLKEAPWQLKGEVDASKRPQNSLLQEVVDFDLTSRPAPIITEQTTLTLEDLIRRRIKDKAWDDVVRKVKPVEDQLAFKKPEILDQSKSKLSLAQVYEAEYLKQKHGDEEEKEPEAHTVIRDSMKKLFAQLDALSHYHYTPKLAQPEVKIVSNTPAIQMEEVAPIAMSNAALLAPEEVKRKTKGDLISKEERTETDKKRERRKKKKFQRERGLKEVQKEDKKKSEESNKSLKTSKAFFEHLNQDVNSLIRTGKAKHKGKGQ